MSKICYVEKNFRDSALETVSNANRIIGEYMQAGYKLTLRQLYYQFVARDLIANKVSEYKRLGSIINDARLAGMIDWNAIEDRTRNLQSLSTWATPESIMDSAARSYREDKWSKQDHRIEVWIEKEALAGVFQRVCEELEVPFFCCRGYVSQSEMHDAALRLCRYENKGQGTVILHFGDHDPSGIDMTRDIRDRMHLFGCDVEIQRLALNMDQVQEYQPPPNPAKEVDPRFQLYTVQYGDESWELDALEPTVLHDLVQSGVEQFRDQAVWDSSVDDEEQRRHVLSEISQRWDEVADFIGEG